MKSRQVRHALEETVERISVFLAHFVQCVEVVQAAIEYTHVPYTVEQSAAHGPTTHERVRVHKEAQNRLIFTRSYEIDLGENIISQEYRLLRQPNPMRMEPVRQGRKMLLHCSYQSH
jgi:hypothetical protein